MTNSKEPAINIAIVGIGRWGIHLVRNFLHHPQAKILALVDRHPELLRAAKEKFQLKENIILATDWEEIRNLPNLEAVVIATPASTHYPLISDALLQGYHVLAEKPLTLYPEEAQKLCELADKQNRCLIVDHTYLFHPAVNVGKQIIQNQNLGQLRYGSAARTHLGPVRQDVDVLWDLAPHDICIFNHWLGENPHFVEATGSLFLKNKTSPKTADLVWAKLIYPSGFIATIHLCWCNPDKQRRLSIIGSQGSLIFDEMLTETPLTLSTTTQPIDSANLATSGLNIQNIKPENKEPLAEVCNHFIDCIQNNNPSQISSGWIGLKIVQILTALTQSLHQKGKTICLEPWEKS
ncbi:Gfo/Idh/MocA family oxidoreductase [Ancylothrix sp. C2]|uniref:Gfo/Idh/MocA family protein n=1 Tax=Ancylothrix sp. D3o TaxID=2953691 RepID=UPI0021BB5217|nr:Gfo/Idh/MocA family oxidoreductase [Ancylothrix sp. D3o]MCT7949012.1 Gfo/Idh/MocA family oxidoreductase [Ancylothrix sp. D3o]